MAPVNLDLIKKIYSATYVGLGTGKDAAITAALNACGIPDTGLVGYIVGKILEQLVGVFTGYDQQTIALAVAITLEYCKRTNTYTKGFYLKNRCSTCKCCGHNAKNHPKGMDQFLMKADLISKTEDANGALQASGFLEADSWWWYLHNLQLTLLVIVIDDW